MSEPEFSIDHAQEISQRLSGQRVIAITPARPGGNNRVFRLEMADGSRLALKYYPAQSADRRDRLGQEYEALSFLAHHGVLLTRGRSPAIKARIARCTNGSTAKPRCWTRDPATPISWPIS